MSDDNKQDEAPPFIDPNSGAAPQPGGFVMQQATETSVESGSGDEDRDPVLDHEIETQAGPAGEQPGNPDGENVSESGQSEDVSGDGNPDATSGASDDDADDADAEDDGEEEKDYSELLSQNADVVKKYIDENPEEKDAVKAAEAEGRNRSSIANY